jgi:hypothetical protein
MTTVQRVIEYNVPHYYKNPPPMAFPIGAALEVVNQAHRADLNGKFGVCVGRDGMRTLILTRLGDTLSVADRNLATASVTVGSRVTVVGIQGDSVLNGQIAHVVAQTPETLSIKLEDDTTVTVGPTNVVLTPEGSDESTPIQPLGGLKKRRLLANLVDSRPALVGAPTLLSGQPIPGATARLIAIDASVALSNQQPILKRCGTLRKLVHGFPGFAQLVVTLMVKLHHDATHPGRQLAPADVAEATQMASVLTDGKLDGIPRKDLKELVQSGQVQLEELLRIADRYCGATHLVFAIDTNFAGVRDTVAAMVQRITGDSTTTEPAVPAVVVGAADPLPIDKAVTSLMANRYAKPVLPDSMDTSDRIQ